MTYDSPFLAIVVIFMVASFQEEGLVPLLFWFDLILEARAKKKEKWIGILEEMISSWNHFGFYWPLTFSLVTFR